MNKKRIIFILALLFILISLYKFPVLVIEHRETGKIAFLTKISPKDEFTIGWMHSVELQPWEEIFQINENYDMVLNRTRFKSFGAGVPSKAGEKSEVKDGWVIFSEIHHTLPKITYGISDYGKHYFIFNQLKLNLYELIPDGDGAQIYTTEISPIFYLIKIISYK